MPAGFPVFAAGVHMDDVQDGAIELNGQPLKFGHKFPRLGGVVYVSGGVGHPINENGMDPPELPGGLLQGDADRAAHVGDSKTGQAVGLQPRGHTLGPGPAPGLLNDIPMVKRCLLGVQVHHGIAVGVL